MLTSQVGLEVGAVSEEVGVEGEELEAGVVFVRHAVLRNPHPPHSTWHTRTATASPSPPSPPAARPGSGSAVNWIIRRRPAAPPPAHHDPLLARHCRHGAMPMPIQVAQRARVPRTSAAASAKLASMSRRGGGTAGGARAAAASAARLSMNDVESRASLINSRARRSI